MSNISSKTSTQERTVCQCKDTQLAAISIQITKVEIMASLWISTTKSLPFQIEIHPQRKDRIANLPEKFICRSFKAPSKRWPSMKFFGKTPQTSTKEKLALERICSEPKLLDSEIQNTLSIAVPWIHILRKLPPIFTHLWALLLIKLNWILIQTGSTASSTTRLLTEADRMISWNKDSNKQLFLIIIF